MQNRKTTWRDPEARHKAVIAVHSWNRATLIKLHFLQMFVDKEPLTGVNLADSFFLLNPKLLLLLKALNDKNEEVVSTAKDRPHGLSFTLSHLAVSY